MTADDNRQLIRRMLDHLRNGTTDHAPAPAVLPAEEFLCAQRLERERQQFFLDTPQVVGFAGEVAKPGSFMTATVLDIPIVVTRAGDGVLRAFINACTHRGARVAEGRGVRKRLTCAFHGWSFALDGHLAGRRDDWAFDGTTAGLVPLPVSDRAGLITVGANPGMTGEQVERSLDGIAPALDRFDLHEVQPIESRRLEVAANWKLVAGLSHEGYHFATLHRESLAPLMHDNGVADFFNRHSRWAFALKGIEQLNEQDESEWPDHFPGAITHTIFPGTVIVVNPDDAEMIRVEPGSTPGASVIHFSGVCRRPEKIDACRDAVALGGDIFENEDLPAAAQCQQGLAAGQPTVLVGRNEPVVQFWHRLWNDALNGQG